MSENSHPRRALVAICECGPIISGLIDLDELEARVGELDEVGFVARHTTLCSQDGQTWLAGVLHDHPGLDPVIAGCTPREHEETFAKVCQAVGRNPYLMSRANIREQCAWVTPDRAQATAKALTLVDAAVARVAHQEPLASREIDCLTSALIVGAGLAGLTAALVLADAGRDVTLVERTPAIGGRVALLGELYPEMECAPCMLEPLMDRVLHHPNIELLTASTIVDVVGYLGNFTATVKRMPQHVDTESCYGCNTCSTACPVQVPDPNGAGAGTRSAIGVPYPGALPNASFLDEKACLRSSGESCDACATACPFGCIDLDAKEQVIERSIGAILIATGSVEASAEEGPRCHLPSNVFTTWEFERMINPDGPTGGEVQAPGEDAIRTIALVHCADPTGRGPVDGCSHTCCDALAKHAAHLAHVLPDAQIIEFVWERIGARVAAPVSAEGITTPVHEIRLRDDDSVEICAPTAGSHSARVRCVRRGKSYALDADLAIVAVPHAGSPDGIELAGSLGADVDDRGFVLSDHHRLRPHASRVEGVYVAGCAQGQKNTRDTATQAAAAAGAILSALVPGRRLSVEAATACVDEQLCGACRTCLLACPYKAISFDEERNVATINEILCRGCGTCAAACPSSAIQARHFTNDQIGAEIRALLHAGS